MTDWLSLLYVGPHQVLPVLVVLVLWVALTVMCVAIFIWGVSLPLKIWPV